MRLGGFASSGVLVQELQQEARTSLAALQKLEDPFPLLFGEQQEHLLLKSDLWVQIPALPPRGDAYMLDTTIPVANYNPPPSDRRHVAQGPAYEEDGCLSGDDPIHFDPPKWETAPAFLGAATLARILVRGLGDRMQTFRIRFALAGPTNPAPRDGKAADWFFYWRLNGVSLYLHDAERFKRQKILVGAAVHPPIPLLVDTIGVAHKYGDGLGCNYLVVLAYSGNAVDTFPIGVVICITLNGKVSARLLDRGPSVVDATEAAAQTPRAVAADSFRCVLPDLLA